MARPEPRRPDWLALTPPAASGQTTAAPVPGQQRDETVRALVFPATAARPATAAATTRRPAGAPSSYLKPAAAAPVPPGSALRAEPAYRSALDRLLQRPSTAPGTAGAIRGGGAAGGGAAGTEAAATTPALPSSRLDSLLASGRPATAVRQQQQQGSSTSLDSLLRRPPVAAGAALRAPLPSSRLDELLARPSTAAGSNSSLRSALAAGGPSTAAAAAAAAQSAALSPVHEEVSPSGRHQPPGGGAAAAAAGGSAGPRPDGSGGNSRPAAAAAGRHAVTPQAAAPAASASAAIGPPAAGNAAAVAALDPGLHDRLRQRIEEAKAQMRQQLSPMFRLSDALLGAGQDAGRAAQALDAATGLTASGFDQLAARPGSRGGSAAASGRPAAAGAALVPRSSDDMRQQAPSLQQEPQAMPQQHERQRHGSRQQQAQHAQEEQQQAPGGWEDGAAPDLHPAFAPGASSADEVDSLVANARAAAARAQSAIAGLTSPPRLHTSVASGAPTGTPSSSSVPRPVAPLPLAQQQQRRRQRREQQPAAEVQLASLGSQQLALPPGDAEAMVAHLREQSEALIRLECERLVAGMHAVLDSLLDSVQHAQRAAQHVTEQAQRQERLEQGREAGQPAGSAGSRGGSEAGDASETAGSVQSVAEENAEQGQQAWGMPLPPPQQLEAGEAGQQPADAAAAADSGSLSAQFAFSPASASQQWEPEQQEGQLQQWESEQQEGQLQQWEPEQQEGQQQQWEPEQQEQSEGATPSAGSPLEAPPNLGGLACGGFGSPFKLPSQHPSPAKAPAAWRAEGQAAPGQAAQQGQPQAEQLPGTTAKSLTFAPLPSAAAGAPADQATPALLRPAGGGLDAYRTARSMGSAASSSGGGSRSHTVASAGGSVAEVAATPGYYSSWSGGGSAGGRTPAGPAAAGLATPLLGGGAAAGGSSKDMDHILGSIRRLAAEMRMKQGILAAPPTTQLWHTGAQAGAAPAAVAASVAKPPR